ncbi:MAG: alpha/beta hydrolase [Betaproteobacteria bacterium]|nr:alpha/beta hydrolase [Betaproteobacteria bacterium]
MNWLLLRGWSREARHWGDFPAALKTAFPGSSIRTPDLPGAGERYRQRSPVRVSAMVDVVRSAERIEGKIHLFGLSLGGMACIDWSTRFPSEVASCVLVNTSVRPFSALHERLRLSSVPRIARVGLAGAGMTREAGILALTSRRGSAALAEQWASYAAEKPVSTANAARQLLAAARFRAPLEAPPVPVLVLASARDELVDPRCSEVLARRWGAKIAWHPDAGHDLPLDDPQWVVAEVKRWLGALAGG